MMQRATGAQIPGPVTTVPLEIGFSEGCSETPGPYAATVVGHQNPTPVGPGSPPGDLGETASQLTPPNPAKAGQCPPLRNTVRGSLTASEPLPTTGRVPPSALPPRGRQAPYGHQTGVPPGETSYPLSDTRLTGVRVEAPPSDPLRAPGTALPEIDVSTTTRTDLDANNQVDQTTSKDQHEWNVVGGIQPTTTVATLKSRPISDGYQRIALLNVNSISSKKIRVCRQLPQKGKKRHDSPHRTCARSIRIAQFLETRPTLSHFKRQPLQTGRAYGT